MNLYLLGVEPLPPALSFKVSHSLSHAVSRVGIEEDCRRNGVEQGCWVVFQACRTKRCAVRGLIDHVVKVVGPGDFVRGGGGLSRVSARRP